MNRNAKNTSSATPSRQSKISRQFGCTRPARIAANGRLEVFAAKASQPAPSLRRRLASIEIVPNSESRKKVPKKTTEASLPLATRWNPDQIAKPQRNGCRVIATTPLTAVGFGTSFWLPILVGETGKSNPGTPIRKASRTTGMPMYLMFGPKSYSTWFAGLPLVSSMKCNERMVGRAPRARLSCLAYLVCGEIVQFHARTEKMIAQKCGRGSP